MPLLDHFHPPLSQRRHWEALPTRWASALADYLNQDWLPESLFAEPQATLPGQLQVDVATLEEAQDFHGGNGPATALRTWTAPPAQWTIPAVFPESFEVQVIHAEAGPRLVAAIELVSPGNKDRPETRRAFAAKCVGYLSQGIAVIVIDVVTSRHGNLHHETIDLLSRNDARFPSDTPLYAAAYHPLRRGDSDEIDIWPATLQIGAPLPTLPLFALDFAIAVDFEATYREACDRLRLT
jgi:hypothetical protein